MSSVGFSALINQPTRIFYYKNSNSVSSSTLDHIITNSSPNFSKAGILITDVSDHLAVFGLMSISKPFKNPLKNSSRRQIRESGKEKLLNCLSKKLEDLNLNSQPDELLENIINSTYEAMDEVFPLKKISNNQALRILNPWMTKSLLKECSHREKLKLKWSHSKFT